MTSIYKTCKIGIVPNISHLQNFLFTLHNYLFGQTHVIQPSSKEQGKGHPTIGVYTFLFFFSNTIFTFHFFPPNITIHNLNLPCSSHSLLVKISNIAIEQEHLCQNFAISFPFEFFSYQING